MMQAEESLQAVIFRRLKVMGRFKSHSVTWSGSDSFMIAFQIQRGHSHRASAPQDQIVRSGRWCLAWTLMGAVIVAPWLHAADDSSASPAEVAAGEKASKKESVSYWISDDDGWSVTEVVTEPASSFRFAQDAQPAPLTPTPELFGTGTEAPADTGLAAVVFGNRGLERSLLNSRRRGRADALTADVVFGAEAAFRATSDTGNLLGKARSTRGVTTKNRSPIITDTRIRGSNVGELSASGSFWFPARQDLDTMLSKIDSRSIDNVIVIKGPYAARYGPFHHFVDFQLLDSPRYECGYESHGSSHIEYHTNGEQWYGRQAVWGGAEDYGYRVAYGHRVGSDYEDGSGTPVPASYNSRNIDAAIGFDPTDDSSIEFKYLRLDQTDVEVATQLLDIDFLVTDAFELTYVIEDQVYYDRLTMEGWYNRTRLAGNANSDAKGATIPFIPPNIRSINTDTDAMSTGFSFFADWYDMDTAQTTLGVDMRYLRQEINQLSDLVFLSFPGIFGNNSTPEVNGPLPDAYWANPGAFVEHTRFINDRFTVRGGARFDVVQSNADSEVNEVGGLSGPLGFVGPNGEFPFVYNPGGDPITLLDPMGNPFTVPGVEADLEDLLLGDFNRAFTLGSAYVTGEYDINCCWTLTGGYGYSMRAPTMSEMYPLQLISTVFPQQSFSILFGNPNLKPEKRYQVDLGLRTNQEGWRGGINAYHAWVEDFITYDLVHPDSFIFQTVNTELATFVGTELFGEYDVNAWTTGFATMHYIAGRDQTRTSNPLPSAFDPPGSELRSGIAGRPEEPLPNIAPLESRVGIRLHEPSVAPRWGVEIAARIVDNQDRLASSLGELPTPGFTVWDARSYWQVNHALTVLAGVENFTDALYQEHLDPHGRQVALAPGLPVNNGLGTVFRPGVNFYFATELVY